MSKEKNKNKDGLVNRINVVLSDEQAYAFAELLVIFPKIGYSGLGRILIDVGLEHNPDVPVYLKALALDARIARENALSGVFVRRLNRMGWNPTNLATSLEKIEESDLTPKQIKASKERAIEHDRLVNATHSAIVKGAKDFQAHLAETRGVKKTKKKKTTKRKKGDRLKKPRPKKVKVSDEKIRNSRKRSRE